MLEDKNLSEWHTRVALSNPANVSPRRIDNSSVANAKSCGMMWARLMIVKSGPNIRKPLQGV